MTAVALALVLGALVLSGYVRHCRRRTVYLRMSDGWLRDHADDPLPEHLQ